MTRNDLCLMYLQQAGLWRPEELARRYEDQNEDAFALVLELVKEFPEHRNRLGGIWADVLHVRYMDLATVTFQSGVVSKVPHAFARLHCVLPLYETDGVVTVAAAEPDNPALFDECASQLKLDIDTVFSFPDEIADAVAMMYQTEGELVELLGQTGITTLGNGHAPVTAEQLLAVAGSEAIIQFTRGLILLALVQRASDIHIEAKSHGVHVRFRIDGALQGRFHLEKSLLSPIATRLKALASLDIVENRRPLDGRFRFELAQRSVDIRFSSVPTLHGESLVLRLLGQAQSKGIPELEDIDLAPAVLKGIEAVSRSPNGIFFVTGPTGSGKTTTLYAALKRISVRDVNVVTVEDPVEYQLEDANQTQVNMAVDLDFATALRAFLRQDPDVILVGEIRDAESARIATQAALTGHLVLATLHTNNSVQAISRLLDIGVEPFFVAPAILAVLSQRLVRRICEHCKYEYPAPATVLAENFSLLSPPPQVQLYRGRGCEKCRFTGFYGRVGIHEFLGIDTGMRDLIGRKASALELEAYAREHTNFKPLRYDGLKKVLRGLTTFEELDKVTFTDVD